PARERTLTHHARPRGGAHRAHGGFLRGAGHRPAAAGTARHGAPHSCRRRRDGPQARTWRSHNWPPAARDLDAPHLRASFTATDGPAVESRCAIAASGAWPRVIRPCAWGPLAARRKRRREEATGK